MIDLSLVTDGGIGWLDASGPESHLVHHQYGSHRHNYADLPIFDMLFGTFRNPERWEARCGLGLEQEHRLVEMLAGKDVGSPSVTPQP